MHLLRLIDLRLRLRLSATLLCAITITTVLATPRPTVISRSPVTLSLARRVNTTSVHNLVRHDQARAKVLRRSRAEVAAAANAANANANANGSSGLAQDRDAAAAQSVQADNQAVTYVATINIGTPPSPFSLLVDTGSSNTWFGAGTAKYASSTSKEAYRLMSVQYGSGRVLGNEIYDSVTLAPDLVVSNQSLGKALFTTGFSGVDGILGLGPADLTRDTLFPLSDAVVPTIMDNLYTQGLIPLYALGIYFESTNSDQGVSNGELTFGGIDESKYIGTMTYTRVTSTSPASQYWGIDQSLTYGNITLLTPGTPGIVDTGTTLILIATEAYQAYASATGATLDNATTLLKITLVQYTNLQNLIFHIGGTDFTLIPDAQIWPRALNADIGGTADVIYLIVGDLGGLAGSGLDFINGFAFLERFYSVFDTGNGRVGIARTAATERKVNF